MFKTDSTINYGKKVKVSCLVLLPRCLSYEAMTAVTYTLL